MACALVWGKVSIETRPVNPTSRGRRRQRFWSAQYYGGVEKLAASQRLRLHYLHIPF